MRSRRGGLRVKYVINENMRIMKNLLLISLVVLLSSCGAFYQIYETQPVGELNDELKFENGDVIVTYNLWGEMGNSSFTLYNKTDKNIYVDLGLTHFIVNDLANTYFKNGVYGEANYVGSESTSGRYSASYNVSKNFGYIQAFADESKSTVSRTSTKAYGEQRVICIPPKSAKIIKGFYINNTLFEDCDLGMYPKLGEVMSSGDDLYNNGYANVKSRGESISFDNVNTPLSMRNIISYGFNEKRNKDNVQVENEFWVKKVINCRAERFAISKSIKKCGKTKAEAVYIYKDKKNFYIRYGRN